MKNKWWVWLIPELIILAIFFLYPLCDVIRMSFTNSQIGREVFRYTLDSYKSVLGHGAFFRVLGTTLIFVGGSVFFQLFLGLITAMAVKTELPGSKVVMLSMICAWVVPGIITGVMWQMLLTDSSWGILNYIIEWLGFKSVPFLYEPGWALFSATLANVWRGSGFSGIVQYGALKAIPKELYEAAEVDGASRWQKFISITLPQLRPMMFINLVLITISTFNTYDSIYALTGGGPGDSTTVISLQAYKQVFQYLTIGKGSVYAVLMFSLSLIFTLIYFKMIKGKEQ